MRKTLLLGIIIWIAATMAIRLWGQYLLQPGQTWQILLLYLISFIAMMWLVRKICNWLAVQKESWINAASLLILPTLVLDSFSCLYFASVFPNIDSAAAGAFGGWMLICCGGGISGALEKK
jgi:predicted neutral ceramidase superfamily lipid hydrolase